MFYNVYEFIALVGRYAVDEETQHEINKVFEYFDAKKRNKLTAIDMKEGFSKLGETVKDKDIDRIFLELDLDADGAIDFEEFLAAMITP
jgi:Ca2+-binding EF-hand superfamily protein